MKLKNPMMPVTEHIPDTEAHVMPDGRTYFYGSYDRDEGIWCSDIYKVFSSCNMEDIRNEGISFRLSQLNSETAAFIYAPDCAYKNGKYYLYSCCRDETEWVAESDSPAGPFEKPSQIEGVRGIDPAVFIDDDGQAYYFWGQFTLNGCRLNEDMRTIQKDSIVRNLVTQDEHCFHEGSSMRKRNGIYYLTFADVSRGPKTPYGGVPTCIGYATSDNPLGPFTYRGVIVDNAESDPKAWNNHGSIEEIEGQWYVFYHRPTRNSPHFRRCACEKIEFDENGLIREALMTSSGANDYLDASAQVFDGSLACGFFDGCYSMPAGRQEEESIAGIGDRCSAVYRWIRFDEESFADIQVKGQGSMQIVFRENKNEIILADVTFDGCTEEKSVQIRKVKGTGELILKFSGKKDFRFDRLVFRR